MWNAILTQETLRRRHPCFVVAPISRTLWADAASDVELYPYTDANVWSIGEIPVVIGFCALTAVGGVGMNWNEVDFRISSAPNALPSWALRHDLVPCAQAMQ